MAPFLQFGHFWRGVLGSPVLSKMNTSVEGKGAVGTYAMTPVELRASFSLASIFALRMLGLFLILPVFAIEAPNTPVATTWP